MIFGCCWKLKNKIKLFVEVVYLLKISRTTLTIAPTTTTHPAMAVMIVGIIGIISVPSIIPEPTARDTSIPTTHIKIPIKLLSFIFIYLLLIFRSFSCGEMEKTHYCNECDDDC